MQVVYVDTLFLINFAMDFISLWFAGKLMHLRRRRRALLLSAFLGGIYGTAASVLAGNHTLTVLIGMAASFLLCFIAYHERMPKRRFICLCALFYGISLLFGGMLTALYQLLARFFTDKPDLYQLLSGGDAKAFFFFAAVLLSVSIIGIAERFFAVDKSAKSVGVSVFLGRKKVTVTGLVDSGNTLRDPLSGRAAIVVNAKAVEGVLPKDVLSLARSGGFDPEKLTGESRRRIRIIPAESLSGNQLLVGYMPDKIELVGEKENYETDALLVIAGKHKEGFNGFSAIVPSVLIL